MQGYAYINSKNWFVCARLPAKSYSKSY